MNYLLFILIIGIITPFSYSQEVKKDSLRHEIEDVVIIGTRTTEKIIDIPYSVFRVDKKELKFGRKVSARDVLADVPGLFLQSRYGNHDLRISIRGFGTRSNSGVRGVRILQDGIPESEPDGETVIDAVDFTSLGTVEVVKGNLSSLYANAPGGVINFVTDMNFSEDFLKLSNQTGKFGLQQNGFKLGLKGYDSKFFMSYNYRNLDGYRKHSHEYQNIFNVVYEAIVANKSTISVLGNYVAGVIKLPGSLTAAEYAEDPFAEQPLASVQDFKRITRKGRLAIKYRYLFGEGDLSELEIVGYGGIKELEKADLNIYTLSTRYSLGGQARVATSFPLFGQLNKLTAGMDYAFQSGPINNLDNIFGQKGISVLNSYDQSLGNLGFYFLDHLNILPGKFDLYVSARFDNNVYKRNIIIPFGSTDTSRVFSEFTPKIGLNYKLTPTIALYTSYGIGYDFPAVSEMVNTPLTSNIKYSLNPDLVPQKSGNFEFGIKGNIVDQDADFMNRIFFEVTYFNYQIKDEIVPFVINQNIYFKNAGKTNRQGVEIGLKTHPLHDMEVVVNYTITNFKFTDYKNIINTPSGNIVEDYTGNKVPSVPSNILNFIVMKEFDLSEKLSTLVLYDCDYIASMPVNDANTAFSSAYFYANLLFGLTYSGENYGAIVFVGSNNFLDRRYTGFLNINDYYGRYYETGEPRTIFGGINFTYNF